MFTLFNMTKLIRVSKNNFERLHQLAGRIQAKTGKRTSIDEAINWLFSRKTEENTDKVAQKDTKNPKINDKNNPGIRLFSLKHGKFLD